MTKDRLRDLILAGGTYVPDEVQTDSTRLIDNIKDTLAPHTTSMYNSPVVLSSEREGEPIGIRIRAKSGQLYVEMNPEEGWQVWSLEEFTQAIRFALKVS